jgi:CheY-like chemotaxis protein
LAISRHLVEMMGGQIWVETEEGKGSTFIFTARLPCSYENPPLFLLSEQPILAGRTIWLMDHTSLIMAQLRDLFKYWGMNVRTFGDGDQLLKAINEVKESLNNPLGTLPTKTQKSSSNDVVSVISVPALLLIPLKGPIDGIQMARSVHSRVPKHRLPIILLCALSERKQEHKADIDAFASLPLKPGELWKASVEAIQSTSMSTPAVAPLPTTSSPSPSSSSSSTPTTAASKTPKRAAAKKDTSTSSAPVRPLHILVAEDNPINQKVIFPLITTLLISEY